ncbi:uncharacterized protein N7484_008315 [Penicillium longicatenatum]|uniref:uncharacterized protein n=1 Tax=Penicillium longicatenatum TaxID=1561947 RepID=UPI00254919E5|nr:uncharacterized protein N7484_008315 [Penicillium longicatenatum]KAJ5635002.1 hypothetical protein N7484_008315 [Penicillium longicatenatum]
MDLRNREGSSDREYYFTSGGGNPEAVFQPDHRAKVDQTDYKDGGKYRSIVKLEMSYEGMPPGAEMASMGTGWLIRPDILVTAGHCVYDHAGNDGQGFGRVIIMQCHIGYNGRDSLKDSSVQTRFAKKIVTTGEWIDSRDNRHRDVAFVQLDAPFTGNLRTFSFAPTPMKGAEMIGVVGYPGDMHLEDSDGIDEIGAQMYELFQDIKYNLEDNALKMLQYRLSTFGGQSGSPVLRKKTPQVSIGAHCYGGADKNSASPIGGQFGNDYNAYISALTTSYPTVTSIAGVNFVKPNALSTTTVAPTLPGREIPTDLPYHGIPSPDLMLEGEEGFLDALKSVVGVVARVGKVALPIASPLLGPLGGPLSAVAGAALSAVASATGAESTTVSIPQATQGATERAVLAEATLQSVLRIQDPELTEKLLRDMQVTYSELAPHVTNLAPKMTPLLKDSALRIAVTQDYMRKRDNVKLSARRGIRNDAESASAVEAIQVPFVEGLLEATRPVDGEEGFFDGLGSFIGKAVTKAAPFALKGAKIGLQLLNNALAPSGEESVSQTQPEDKDDLIAATLLTKRAVMAEAALRAVMKLDKNDFDRASSSQTESLFGPEGFFDGIKSMVQVLGSAVSKAAPKVISTLLPIAADALGKKIAGSSSRNDGLSPSPALVRKQRSFADINAAYNPGSALEVSAIEHLAPAMQNSARSISTPVVNEFKATNLDALITTRNPDFYKRLQS